MTMAMAWIREQKETRELIMATDSRLRFGCEWDCCPKLFLLPRTDASICFSGDTMYAYPIINQAINCVNQHFKSKTRAQSLADFKGHLLRILNNMTSLICDLPPGDALEPKAEFILAGYDWKSNDFKMWLLHFDYHYKKFTYRPTKYWNKENRKKKIVFSGDYKEEFKTKLIELLRRKGNLESGSFDMEPFEILRDMIRDKDKPLIGGSPQIVKIYRHMNAIPLSVYWPDSESNNQNILGRPLLDYEHHGYLKLNPDTLEISE